jgi:hypothetical protein
MARNQVRNVPRNGLRSHKTALLASGTGSVRQFVSKATRHKLPRAFRRSVRLHTRRGDFASGGLAFGFQKFDYLSNLAPSPSRNFILLIADPGGGGGS